MSDAQFNQYNNLIIFARDRREYKLISKQLDKESFRKAMQSESYVRIDCIDPKKSKEVLIYLFDKDSKYTNSSQDLKRLLKKFKNPTTLLLITYKSLTTYSKKVVNSFKKLLTIFDYRHEIFDLILPNGPLCYPHRVMSRDEVIKLANEDLCCYITGIPRIFDEDPQCIWIGAEVGDIIEIKMLSDITGETYQYRVVIPKSGKVIAYKEVAEETDEKEEKSKDKKGKKVDDEDDEEILEHRENVSDNDDDFDENAEPKDDEDVDEGEDHEHNLDH